MFNIKNNNNNNNNFSKILKKIVVNKINNKIYVYKKYINGAGILLNQYIMETYKKNEVVKCLNKVNFFDINELFKPNLKFKIRFNEIKNGVFDNNSDKISFVKAGTMSFLKATSYLGGKKEKEDSSMSLLDHMKKVQKKQLENNRRRRISELPVRQKKQTFLDIVCKFLDEKSRRFIMRYFYVESYSRIIEESFLPKKTKIVIQKCMNQLKNSRLNQYLEKNISLISHTLICTFFIAFLAIAIFYGIYRIFRGIENFFNFYRESISKNFKFFNAFDILSEDEIVSADDMDIRVLGLFKLSITMVFMLLCFLHLERMILFMTGVNDDFVYKNINVSSIIWLIIWCLGLTSVIFLVLMTINLCLGIEIRKFENYFEEDYLRHCLDVIDTISVDLEKSTNLFVSIDPEKNENLTLINWGKIYILLNEMINCLIGSSSNSSKYKKFVNKNYYEYVKNIPVDELISTGAIDGVTNPRFKEDHYSIDLHFGPHLVMAKDLLQMAYKHSKTFYYDVLDYLYDLLHMGSFDPILFIKNNEQYYSDFMDVIGSLYIQFWYTRELSNNKEIVEFLKNYKLYVLAIKKLNLKDAIKYFYLIISFLYKSKRPNLESFWRFIIKIFKPYSAIVFLEDNDFGLRPKEHELIKAYHLDISNDLEYIKKIIDENENENKGNMD